MNFFASLFSEDKKPDDLLSPILVKELRQGMRARVFVFSFLLLQMFLIFLVLGNLAAQDDRRVLEVQNSFFWVILGFALLVLMPLRGLVAISQETKNRTMETIMLTRLTAWRVVFGKWSALFAQSLLLVSAVLPYVVLRYFIGGNDVVSDFMWVLLMLWLSGILIAASLGVSALGNPIIRIVILVGIVSVMVNITTGFSPRLGADTIWENIGWLVLFGFFVPALLFEITASTIAPHSENHAIRRRVLALLFFILSAGLYWVTGSNFELGLSAPLFVLIGVCYYELAEKPRLYPRMIRTMSSKGFPGKVAGYFLLPGWPSALLFSLAAIPLVLGTTYYFHPSVSDYGPWLPIFAVLGSVLVPICICHLLWPKMEQVLFMVVLYNLILTALSSLIEGFVSLIHTNIDGVFAFVPSLPTLIAEENADSALLKEYGDVYALVNGLVLGLVLLLLFLGSRKYYSGLRALYGSSTAPILVPDEPKPEPDMP